MTDAEKDQEIGRRTRALLESVSSLTDMLAVGAPTPMLVRGLDEIEKLAIEIDQLAGTQVYEKADFFSDISQLMRLYEVFQQRQAQKPRSE